MKYSVAAYLARLPKKKAEQLWEEWVVHNSIPSHITSDTIFQLKC